MSDEKLNTAFPPDSQISFADWIFRQLQLFHTFLGGVVSDTQTKFHYECTRQYRHSINY